MSVLLDTGILYAYYDRSDDWHAAAVALIKREARSLILPALVLPELDHLLGARLGPRGRDALYQGISGKHFFVADLPASGYARAAEIDRQFADLSIGLVDAAIVALASALNVPRVATANRRHFTPLAKAFSLTLLP